MNPGIYERGPKNVDWIVANPGNSELHEGPDMTFGTSRFHLQVFYSTGTCSFYIKLVGYVPLSTHFQITVHLSRDGVLFLPQTTTIDETGDNIWVKPKSEVLEVSPDIMSQSTLCFRIFIRGIGDSMKSDNKSVQTPAYFDLNGGVQSLSEDLSKLLDEDSSTDVELRCGDVTFKAHRNVLGVRSEVFRAMLASGMTEGQTGRVQIADTEADLFRQFLRYLYTGKLEELTVDTATRLYQLGDKYNVEVLKRQCASFLAENLSQDNACGILSLADRHTDSDLKEIATVYVLDQNVPLQEDIWSDFCRDHPVLAFEVLNRSFKLYASCK